MTTQLSNSFINCVHKMLMATAAWPQPFNHDLKNVTGVMRTW